MIEIKDLHKTFFSELGTEKKVFRGLDFTINDGDFITVIGSNGAGKSTLLNVLNGQVIPDAGEIILNGQNITTVEQHKRAKWISQVYQKTCQWQKIKEKDLTLHLDLTQKTLTFTNRN